MRRGIYLVLVLVILAIAGIVGALLWSTYYGEVEMPNLASNAKEFGEIQEKTDESDTYIVSYNILEAQPEVIQNKVNDRVNELLEKFKKENETEKSVFPKQRGVFKSVIDTRKVTEEIVSVKITTMTRKYKTEEYKTQVDTFNFNIKNESEIALKDLFKDEGINEVLGNTYQDKYLLREKEVEFYNENNSFNAVSYLKLKDYYKGGLSAKNFGMTEEEYQAILPIPKVDPTKKMIAITFDDGPHKTNTQQILDCLAKYNGRATFFMVGTNVKLYPDVVKSVYESGSEIGIHTWNHKQLTKISQEEVKQEIESVADAVYEITGYRPKIVRPPYGSVNSTVTSAVPYPFVNWNIDSLDWKSRDENQIYPLVMDNVHDGDIILLHDIHSTTVPAAKRIIEALHEQGYQLVTVSELLEAKGYDTKTTRIFYSGRQ